MTRENVTVLLLHYCAIQNIDLLLLPPPPILTIMKKTTVKQKRKDMSADEIDFHFDTIQKYRDLHIIPPIAKITRMTRISHNTISRVFNGTSKRPEVVTYIQRVLTANFKTLPDDLKQLFEIWDRIKKSV